MPRRVRLLLLLACLALPMPAAAREFVVFAAASLQESLDALGARWAAARGLPPPRFAYAGSGALARQVEQGAPAQVFVSADEAWMDVLDRGGALRPGTRRVLASNRLVLVAPADAAPAPLALEPAALSARLGGGRLALADTAAVPAGRYAREALGALGLWPVVAGRLAEADSVRGALAYVARGEAPLGIVYATDARVEPRVRVLADFPDGSHAPIRYPAALLRGAGPEAADFLAFLSGPEARAVFAGAGFGPP